ncbi:MAG: hypothetical protein K2V38_20370, partial [Gemmataceae bacterium]|nr:hypothetical protein [Gemmataceae bacterium]
MLTLTVVNKLETQQLTHAGGPLEVGRGPAREGAARLVVRDGFVSRDHLRLEERPGRKVRVTNLSAKSPVAADAPATLAPGAEGEFVLPVRLSVGETTIDVDAADAEPASVNIRTIAGPARDGTVARPVLLERAESAKPEEIVDWLGVVIDVQSAGSRDDFFRRTADALVNHIGLDAGLVLLRDGGAWR